jgi:hypothetical protein
MKNISTISTAGNKTTRFATPLNIGKTLLVLFLGMISTLTVSAQKSVVLDAFSKHGIDVSILNPDNLQQPDDYAYDLKQTTITKDKETVTIAKFNPAGPQDEQWTVVSVNGKAPSKYDTNTFRKNQAKPATTAKTDDASYKIEKETPEYLVVSYKSDPATISKDASFMKDCRSYLTVNLGTKKLEQVQTLNEKPLKIKILNAEKFDLVQKYTFNEQAKRYFAVNNNLNILAKFLGQGVNIQTITEYSNYTKK